MSQQALEVTPDTQVPSMLQHYCNISGESYYICERCGIPYVTHQHYRNAKLCVECSGHLKAYDHDLRRSRQRGYKKVCYQKQIHNR